MTDHPRITGPRPLLPFTVEREECFVVVTPALADKLTRWGLAREPTEEDLYQAAAAIEEQKVVEACMTKTGDYRDVVYCAADCCGIPSDQVGYSVDFAAATLSVRTNGVDVVDRELLRKELVRTLSPVVCVEVVECPPMTDEEMAELGTVAERFGFGGKS